MREWKYAFEHLMWYWTYVRNPEKIAAAASIFAGESTWLGSIATRTDGH